MSWAGDGPVPLWFDIAQDLTERWVHQMQMREAVGRVEDYAQRYLPTVLAHVRVGAAPPVPRGIALSARLCRSTSRPGACGR